MHRVRQGTAVLRNATCTSPRHTQFLALYLRERLLPNMERLLTGSARDEPAVNIPNRGIVCDIPAMVDHMIAEQRPWLDDLI